ncbi:MAG: hypothetical protein Q7T20_10540 [Saprospiraceae bacterium]|nr:hypothetical protein [Saprospiraceae bacterium]
MASITVKIKSEELDESFLKSIRALFKNRQVSVTFESDDTVALGQMKETLTTRDLEGASYTIPGDAFDELLQAAESDENYDVIASLKEFKVN